MTRSEGGAAGKRRRLVGRERKRKEQVVECARKTDECVARKDYAAAAVAQAELAGLRSAPVHENQEAKQRSGEKNERERKAETEEYARKIDELLAQKDYASAPTLQALMDTLGSAAGQAQEEHEAAGGTGALDPQEAKCAQDIETGLAGKDHAGVVAARAELVQRRSACQERSDAKRNTAPHRKA